MNSKCTVNPVTTTATTKTTIGLASESYSNGGTRSCHASASASASASVPPPAKSTVLSKCKKGFFISVSIFVLVMSILFVQSVLHLLMFRKHFGNAPIPVSPSHGVIAAHVCPSYDNDNDNDDNDADNDTNNDNGDQFCSSIRYHYNYDGQGDASDMGVDAGMAITNYTFKAYNPERPRPQPQESTSATAQASASLSLGPPLRLLVIGDSVARGVGQAYHCSPVLPQAIGKYLSRHLNGRAVYWTTMAEPGASTKLLSKLVAEDHKKQKRRKLSGRSHNVNVHGNVTTAADDADALTSGDDGPMYSLKRFRNRHMSTSGSAAYNKKWWIENLEYHKELYSQNSFGNYDIIIVMSGLNDVKQFAMPFVFDDDTVDDEDFNVKNRRGNKKVQERGFAGHFNQLIHLLSMEQYNDSLNGDSVCSIDESSVEEECPLSPSSSKRQQLKEQQHQQQKSPLILLPQFPSDRAPVIMAVILKKMIVKMTIIMELMKGRIADQYDNVISPDAPSHDFSMNYLLQRDLKSNIPANDTDDASGLVDGQDVIVNLIDIAQGNCKMMEDNMTKFYSQRNAMDFCYESPLLKLYAPDGFHPSDFGYDMFGQLLAKEILKKWGSQ